ncbi:MAG: TlyA family RNA methyltransferase [Dermatophilaceae bacterium]
MTTRLDSDLVRRGLARSRAVARQLIVEGHVSVDGRIVTRPATLVGPDAGVSVRHTDRQWVGRGAEKLLAALTAFAADGLRVAGRRAIDVGASTGGFTEVLLTHGAASIAAVDVGHGQLAPSIAGHARVTDYSGVSVRGLDPAAVGGRGDLVVADLSFISLTMVMSDLAALCAPGGDLVLLVKPQFEVGRERLGRGGVVRSPELQSAAVRAVGEAARTAGLRAFGLIRSPLTGSHGNVEYLLWLRPCLPEEDVGMPWHALVERAERLAAPTVHQEEFA